MVGHTKVFHKMEESNPEVAVRHPNQTTPKKRRAKKNLTHGDIERILTLRAKGVTIKEIAGAMDRHKRTIENTLNQYKNLFQVMENLDYYLNVRSRILNASELMAVKSVTDELKRDRAHLGHRVSAFKELYNARRLEEDKSTQNVASKTTTFITVDPKSLKPTDE